jgi:NADP-dependent aldehyde dehydrogenase
MTDSPAVLRSVDPRTGRPVGEVLVETTLAELDDIVGAAVVASAALQRMGRTGRVAMLRAMAAALEERREPLVAIADQETALGTKRLGGELTRTTYQLALFAEVLEEASYLEVTIDHRGDTPAGPRPDLRRMLLPRGPVGVFGASNFPFAFSVPGGDTVSALAAGSAVVVNVHPAHPATSLACQEALAAGARSVDAPADAVTLVAGRTAARALVEHPSIQAIGFTGSLEVGRELYDVAAARPNPIPFFGELGAVNAVVICPDAARTLGADLAAGLVASFTLGVGQFCTKPGLVLLPAGESGGEVQATLQRLTSDTDAAVMLSERTLTGFEGAYHGLLEIPGVELLSHGISGAHEGGWWGTPVLLSATAEALPLLATTECFGPAMVLCSYDSAESLERLVGHLGGGLTATVHATSHDDLGERLLAWLTPKVGRVVWNGFPTGVAVSWAMQHGGPYPAATDSAYTSVGATAIRRWLRPVAFQEVPQALLPAELRDGNTAIPRRVDGRYLLPDDCG